MRNRFTRACYAVAAVVAVTTTLGLSAAGAADASTTHVRPNATPSCGDSCINLFSVKFGPDWVQTSIGGSSNVGNIVGLTQASNNASSQDFVGYEVGLVTVMCDNWPAPGSLSPNSYACLNYAFPYYLFGVFEANYSPLGSPTNVCAGLAKAPYTNERVTLQTCGKLTTEWVPDTNNFSAYFLGGFTVPWINAADTPSSHPQVLTATSWKHHQEIVRPESLYSNGPTVIDTQQWGIIPGILP
jgi:hypothetical protein